MWVLVSKTWKRLNRAPRKRYCVHRLCTCGPNLCSCLLTKPCLCDLGCLFLYSCVSGDVRSSAFVLARVRCQSAVALVRLFSVSSPRWVCSCPRRDTDTSVINGPSNCCWQVKRSFLTFQLQTAGFFCLHFSLSFELLLTTCLVCLMSWAGLTWWFMFVECNNSRRLASTNKLNILCSVVERGIVSDASCEEGQLQILSL